MLWLSVMVPCDFYIYYGCVVFITRKPNNEGTDLSFYIRSTREPLLVLDFEPKTVFEIYLIYTNLLFRYVSK